MPYSLGIYTLGCKVNQYESRAIYEVLEGFGVRFAEKGETADICIRDYAPPVWCGHPRRQCGRYNRPRPHGKGERGGRRDR